jgi:hypothetical protein
MKIRLGCVFGGFEANQFCAVHEAKTIWKNAM